MIDNKDLSHFPSSVFVQLLNLILEIIDICKMKKNQKIAGFLRNLFEEIKRKIKHATPTTLQVFTSQMKNLFEIMYSVSAEEQ